ncbi:apoptosis-inducing factor 3-like isoform X2 [Daphnia pulex]|uniref:apoptosis-inducing factor 3-like isoform X2 n=1 Tax=Daphnia pulex TaxID=6669 RepID=UPI001EE1546D|nr:apoptosis-inducing factor 3-like isoform X2 [Daphnia pulex]
MGINCTKASKVKPQQQQQNQQVESRATTVDSVPAKASVAEKMSDTKKDAPQDNSIPTLADGEIDKQISVEEYKLCLTEDLKENEMKVFEAGEKQILVVKENGNVYAMGAKCTHFGAPLSSGIFCKGKVYCPWHGACFNSKTGDIEEFPALDPIPVYTVNVDPNTNEVKVKINNKTSNESTHKPLCKTSKDSNEVVLIIGSGAAGHSCAETLRQEGFTGRVIIVTKDEHLPYDRTKLSKAMNLEAKLLSLRSNEYYSKGDIKFMFENSVEGVDVEAKSVLLSNGVILNYSSLVVATGGRPRPVPCPGTHLANVFLLRTPNDANRIHTIANNKEISVVIVGTSFIGMEVAAYLVDKAASVTVVGRSSTPFAHVFGSLIGRRLQQLHEEKGVKFIMDSEVGELLGDEEGKLTEVILTCGRTLKADILVAGLGVLPSTEFLRDSEIVLDSRGFVPVDEHMRTNCRDVYAVGDIASFPLHAKEENETRKLVNIGHWQMALHHGRTAALTIMGRSEPIYKTTVPFFWSSMFGKSVRYCGYAPQFDDVVIHGDLENLKFVAFLCEQENVLAIVTLNYDPLAIQFAALLREGKTLLKQDISEDPKGWTTKLQDL